MKHFLVLRLLKWREKRILVLLEIIKQWVISTISIAFHLHLIVPSDLLLLQLIPHGAPSQVPMTCRTDSTTTPEYKARSQTERQEQKMLPRRIARQLVNGIYRTNAKGRLGVSSSVCSCISRVRFDWTRAPPHCSCARFHGYSRH